MLFIPELLKSELGHLFLRAPYHSISHQASICGPGTYSPGDNCGKASGGLEFRAEKRGPFGVWEGIQK